MRIGDDLTAAGLNRILEHDPGDLTCTVEAGVRLSELRAALAASGQRLSLDPPGDPTIGALLAQNLSGPLRHRFGAPRDLVLGATLVLADGTIASAGGKVVKNVAGYDLARLVCGSEGRLALIGRASFRLHPVPTGDANARRRDRRRGSSGGVAPPLAAAAERARRPPPRPRGSSLRGIGASGRRTARGRAGFGGRRGGRRQRCGRNRGSVRRAARGRLRFAPGDLATTLEALAEAVVRPASGVAYVPEPTADEPNASTSRLFDAIRAQLDPQGVLAA